MAREIRRRLAKEGPLSPYDLQRGSYYSLVHGTIKELQAMGQVSLVAHKRSQKGGKKDVYSLTSFGRLIALLDNTEGGTDILEGLVIGEDPGGVVSHPDLYPGGLAIVAKALRESPDLRADILDGYRAVVAALEKDTQNLRAPGLNRQRGHG